MMRMKKTILLLFSVLLMFSHPARSQHRAHSVLASGTWYKMAIGKTGVYKIGTSHISALNGTPIQQIALYGQPGGMLNLSNASQRPDDLSEMAIDIMDQNDNGVFDNGDYILFYAEDADVWTLTANNRFEYSKNIYSDYNFVFLTTTASNGRRIRSMVHQETVVDTITQYTAYGTWHNDLTNTHRSGQIWVGEKFNHTISSRTFDITMPQRNSASTLEVRLALASIESSGSNFSVTYNGTTRNLYLNADSKHKIFYENFGGSAGATISFDIRYQGGGAQAAGYLDFIEVNVSTPLIYPGQQFSFRNKSITDSNKTALFTIGNAPDNMVVWDVTNPADIRSMLIQSESGAASFRYRNNPIGEFVAFQPNGQLYSPLSIQPVDNQDIHGSTTPDYVIVTLPDYLEQAQRLATLHTIYDGMDVLVATDESIYNEFSSGRQDPMAIREMLIMFERRNPQTTRYLLLFGKGTYDNRNIGGSPIPNLIAYQSYTSFDDDGKSYVTDHIYGYLGENEQGLSHESIDIGIGRLPATSRDEAQFLVDKIERYMTKADLDSPTNRGDWRNYVALLADDADPSCGGDTVFTTSSEKTARQIRQHYPNLNIDCLYADSYVQQSGAIGSYYPDLNNALKKRMDYGCLLLNYIGHGSVEYIGTERYMMIDDISNYSNFDKLTFFVTSTCSFGHFDIPDSSCGAEAFLMAPAAGIGVIAAARPIGHIQKFNTELCVNALNPQMRVGDALRQAMNNTRVAQCITLLGDPALRLSFPNNEVAVTSINQQEVSSDRNDTATVLSEVTVKGEIQNSEGAVLDHFNGTLFPIVFDREGTYSTLANDNEGTEVTFTQQKNILYKGRCEVVDGRFEYRFIVPRDVAYNYDYGKLSHYARSNSIPDDASGNYQKILFGGFNEDAAQSTDRPSVRLFINDSSFRDGGITDCNPSIFAILADSAGINSVGSGLGHDITATLDENGSTIMVLNDFYETDFNDPRRGYINYKLTGLTPGQHTLVLKAWNIFNMSGSDTVTFFVKGDDTLTIGNFFATPNPATQHTELRIEHNIPDLISHVEIVVYNMQGMPVRHFKPEPAAGSYVITSGLWNFSSDSGHRLPPGLYVARAILTTPNGETLTETAKVVISR